MNSTPLQPTCFLSLSGLKLRLQSQFLFRCPLACCRLTVSFCQSKMFCSHILLTPCCLFGGRPVLVISFYWQPKKEVKAVSSWQPSCVYSSVSVHVCVHLNVAADRCLRAKHTRKWSKNWIFRLSAGVLWAACQNLITDGFIRQCVSHW